MFNQNVKTLYVLVLEMEYDVSICWHVSGIIAFY